MDAGAPKNYLIDMDGVLLRGDAPIPGAAEFLARLIARQARFLLLTNNSLDTPGDVQHRLQRIGLDLPAERIYTSALATARFLYAQQPQGTAYVLGESGLTTALHDIGYRLVDAEPEYVVVDETTAHSFERITRAVRLVVVGLLALLFGPRYYLGWPPRTQHAARRGSQCAADDVLP